MQIVAVEAEGALMDRVSGRVGGSGSVE
jgi:hypothetical protein